MNPTSSGGSVVERFRAAATLHQGGQLERAAALYSQIVRDEPGHADALHMLGLIALQQDRATTGVDLIGQSLRRNPNQPMAHANLARALEASSQPAKAVASLDAALRLLPRFTEALLFRGNLHMQMGMPTEALADYDKAITLQPDFAAAFNNRCGALLDLNRPFDALQSADQALAIEPQFAEAHNNRGNALRMLRHSHEAITCFERALALRPAYPEAISNLCGALYKLKRHEETLSLYQRLLDLEPDYPYALGARFHAELHCCEWRDYPTRITGIEQAVLAGRRVAHPGAFLSVSHAPAEQLLCASAYIGHKFSTATPRPAASVTRQHGRIRVAYVSADFGEHPVTHLVAGVLACHDKSRFEVHGISLGTHDPNSEMQQKLRGSFTGFHDVAALDDAEAAKLMASLEIDIAVDLNGHTLGGRQGIFSLRPAPVQATYLGYAGTTGAPWFDYLLADAVVVPPGEEGYSERIVRLPGSFMPRDDRQSIPPAPARSAEGLPDNAFVFCAFNPGYKLTPEMFDVWMRLLHRVPESVLWLRHPGEVAKTNLAREAVARGVATERLVFARRIDGHGQHLARQGLADLFLDTRPCNAHTTASDALYVGLPVLTCRGTTFAGRVAESLLRALELPELVAEDLAQYEQLAARLALEPPELQRLRERLDRNRRKLPLFDTQRYTRNLEAAYQMMIERHRAGEAPRDFNVTLS